ncbi:MAG TPA: UDP-3-O-acyl-N-acetylglucosamine deacetylase [Thiotrichaceae bacterium]|nr:UDP-3-O-acyl-N-acetylglucosamine deacetylase [Thiotrichaceae bacterium]
MQAQRTLKSSIRTTGIGLHSGKKVKLILTPAPVDTGVVFTRSDIKGSPSIKATPLNVGDAVLNTTLINEHGVKVSTIEHLMSALAGMGVDNLYVSLTAEEVPIMDGSASPFLYLIQSAGIEEQSAYKKFIKIKRKIEVSKGDIYASLEPSNGFKVAFEIDFQHPAVIDTQQIMEVDLSRESYSSAIARARTFGFMKDVEMMRSKNLGLGGNLGNAVVLDDYRVLNDNLRYDDEFVTHKILDAIGDLYTLGYGIMGRFYGYKSGHAVNNLLVRQLLKEQDAWELVSAEAQVTPPISYQTALVF